MKLFIFDMDGVLIQPVAYYECINRTVTEFARMVGHYDSDSVRVTPEEIHRFESEGIYSPWKMSALLCADIVKMCSPDSIREVFDSDRETLIAAMLDNVRCAYKSPTTQLYQRLLLRGEFESVYGLKGCVDGESLLKSLDKPLLSKTTVSKLRASWLRGEVSVCAFTGRPSGGLDSGKKGYSPEAEVGLELIGFSDMPLVGFGEMQWLAEKYELPISVFTKPRLPHALATLLSVRLSETPEQNLEDAFKLSQQADIDLADYLKSPLEVFLFEDTSAGILPFRALMDKNPGLREIISLTVLGIASDPRKRQSLTDISDFIFEDTEAALQSVI